MLQVQQKKRYPFEYRLGARNHTMDLVLSEKVSDLNGHAYDCTDHDDILLHIRPLSRDRRMATWILIRNQLEKPRIQLDY